MVTIDSLYELTNALSSGTIADPLLTPVLPKTEVPIPKICMAHYGQIVSTEWLLLTAYRHLPAPYLMPAMPTLLFPTKQGY